MLQQENYLQSRKYNKKVIMFTLLLGSFIALFNETILNIAFPKLMAEMNVGATTVQWLTTGYVLVIAILMPVTAFLMNTFEHFYNKEIIYGSCYFIFNWNHMRIFFCIISITIDI